MCFSVQFFISELYSVLSSSLWKFSRSSLIFGEYLSVHFLSLNQVHIPLFLKSFSEILTYYFIWNLILCFLISLDSLCADFYALGETRIASPNV